MGDVIEDDNMTEYERGYRNGYKNGKEVGLLMWRKSPVRVRDEHEQHGNIR